MRNALSQLHLWLTLRSTYKSHVPTVLRGLAPIFPYTFYYLTYYWFAVVDIPVANDTPVHCADA
ncbi:hypothetical protein ACZ87_02372, partial [Candidatus Erwinia dacicola]